MDIAVFTEYGRLESCLTCPPAGPLGDAVPINAVQQRYFADDPPDFRQLRAEHRRFEEALRAAGVRTFKPAGVASPFQLFCRDVGFAVGRRFFVSDMAKSVRRAETLALDQWLTDHGIAALRCPVGPLEGGDVLVDAPELLVGIGERTSAAAAEWLARAIAPRWRVTPVELTEGVLHLDCVVALVAPGTMVYCPELIGSGRLQLERLYRRRITISPEQSFDMACNVLALGPRVLVEAHQTDLIRRLEGAGVATAALDGTELRKFGGLFRCAVCPLVRACEL